MTREEMDALRPGDLIRHKHSSAALVVHDNCNGVVTACRIETATNPIEWDRVALDASVVSSDWKPPEVFASAAGQMPPPRPNG